MTKHKTDRRGVKQKRCLPSSHKIDRLKKACTKLKAAFAMRAANDPFEDDDRRWYTGVFSQELGARADQSGLVDEAASLAMNIDRLSRLKEFIEAKTEGRHTVPDPVADQLEASASTLRQGGSIKCSRYQAERLACFLIDLARCNYIACWPEEEPKYLKEGWEIAPWSKDANAYYAIEDLFLGVSHPLPSARQRWIKLIRMAAEYRRLFHPEWRKLLVLWETSLVSGARARGLAVEVWLDRILEGPQARLAAVLRQSMGK